MNWCRRNMFSVIEKTLWPANSPDLNPLDYFYWTAVERQMKGKKFRTHLELTEGIKEAMSKVPLKDIQYSIHSCMSRCRKVEKANGDYVLS